MIKDDIEYKSVEEIKAYQEGLLHEALAYLKEHSPYYQRMFKSYGINIDKIQHIEDLVKIPFTEKKDLQLFNDEFLCCPKAKIIDYITTSGTLGDPVTFGCTEKDLQRLAYNEKKSFECAGVKPGTWRGCYPCGQRHPGTTVGHHPPHQARHHYVCAFVYLEVDRICRGTWFRLQE